MIHTYRDGKWVQIGEDEAAEQVREAIKLLPREVEFLKGLGVTYPPADIKAEALRLGLIGKWWKRKLTRRKKALAIYSLVMEDNK